MATLTNIKILVKHSSWEDRTQFGCTIAVKVYDGNNPNVSLGNLLDSASFTTEDVRGEDFTELNLSVSATSSTGYFLVILEPQISLSPLGTMTSSACFTGIRNYAGSNPDVIAGYDVAPYGTFATGPDSLSKFYAAYTVDGDVIESQVAEGFLYTGSLFSVITYAPEYAVTSAFYKRLAHLFFVAPKEKAINPTPNDEAINIETTPSVILQWEPGNASYPPDSYMVYVGGGLWFDDGTPTTNTYLEYTGKIFAPDTVWRVDSIYGEETIEGDEWTFIPKLVGELSTPLTEPSDPTPIDGSIVGGYGSVTCKWSGDSRMSSFKVSRSINGGAFEEV